MSLMKDVQARLDSAAARAAEAVAEEQEVDGSETETEAPPTAEAVAPTAEAAADETAAADPAEVAEYCAANGCAPLAGPLIREKATMQKVKDRVGSASSIRAMVAEAGSITETITAAKAEEFIKAGLSVEQARTKLWEAVVAAQSPEIRGAISADTAINATSWDKAVEKANARIEGQQPKEG